MSFIEVKNLAVAFNGNQVIENVTFAVDKGDVVSIIGPNGSGKTTLVRAMLGLIEHKGTVTWNGTPFREHLGEAGYVPQRFDFDRTFPISVDEFLNLPDYKPDTSWREEMCREFGVTDILKKKLGTLSGGQMQRVLIVSSLLKKPELLILDGKGHGCVLLFPACGFDDEYQGGGRHARVDGRDQVVLRRLPLDGFER
jgi:zinc transport system ATP-binding protein